MSAMLKPLADHVRPARQSPLQRRERLLAALVLGRQRVRIPPGVARVHEPEARDGDVRLDVVLLEEHPLQGERVLVVVLRREARASCQIPDDRAGLAQRPAVVEDQRRHAHRRIEITDDLWPVGAIDDIERTALEWQAEMRGQQADLVAIARDGRVVEDHAATIPPRRPSRSFGNALEHALRGMATRRWRGAPSAATGSRRAAWRRTRSAAPRPRRASPARA